MGDFLGQTRRWWLEELVIIPVGWIIATWFILWLFNTGMTARIFLACWLSGVAYRAVEGLIRVGLRGHQ